ncbi:HAMP domain-containing histidine kinase [Cohnella pontilimi]|uniref:histidine kinase n=1 Tax=Cohnella pontilimi TaxID=2564100 RepID=A0A4U0F312_9BACL|nr:HAMP domain-containing sensor histidine kinase [Cohnella pontilimi]TJY38931.1 HAMP domain-containing histidine kinase [Cohnella pontilimi]
MERIEQHAGRLWRNPAVRRLALLLTAAFAAAALFIWLFSLDSSERLKRQWLEQQAAMIGKMSAADPGLTAQWASLLAHPESLSPEDKENGKRLAEQYGLTPNLEAQFIPVLSAYSERTVIALAAGFFLLIGLLGAAILREYHRQSADIRKLAVSLEDTVKHNRPMAFRLYEEGELGLLANAVQELAIRLQETIGQLHQEKDFLKDTVADISHQLKTPLASLTIYLDLLREGNVDQASASEFLDTCRRELDRMEWLIQTLLKIARLEADALQLILNPVPVQDTVDRSVMAVKRLADNRGVHVAVIPPALSADGPVPHDPRWLAEALANLIKNAVEHTPSGGEVTIGWETTTVFLRLYVQDQGPGIDEKHLPHIFKKFYRTSRAGSGVGLGLPLAKTIVERHGGMLTASSRKEGGSRFVLTLPLHSLPDTDTI